jgi:DNA-binding transcriptional regulator YdaS (Cro superfamily)
MHLINYLKSNHISQCDFAQLVGISEGAVANYIRWRRKPTLSIALRIQEVTGGKVTVKDLNDYWELKQKYG